MSINHSPLEEYPQTSIGREKSPLHKVELVEVLKQEGDAAGVSENRKRKD